MSNDKNKLVINVNVANEGYLSPKHAPDPMEPIKFDSSNPKGNSTENAIKESLCHDEELIEEMLNSNIFFGLLQIILVILTGSIVGIWTIGFQKSLEALEELYIHDFAIGNFSTLLTCIIMILSSSSSSFIALYISRKWFPECLGGGILPLKIAIGVSSPIPYYIIFARAIITAIYVPFGNPLGIEGPILHMAGAIASQFYLIATFILPDIFENTLSTTLIVGTAAGISAAFNTPLVGIFYILEEFIDIRKFGFVTILVGFASVSAIVVVRLTIKEEILFTVNPTATELYRIHDDVNVIDPWMLASIPFGIFCGYVGYVFKLSILYTRDWLFYDRNSVGFKYPYIVIIISGVIVGVIGTFSFLLTESQYSWGSGAHWIDEVFLFNYSGWRYFGYGSLKMIACIVTVSVGGNGGVFIPALVIGASVGGAFSSLMCTLFDDGTNSLDVVNNQDCVWYYSFIIFGMVGVFTSILRLPLTSIVIVYELTNFVDIASSLMIPLLTCVLCSFAVNLYLEEDSIYELLLKQDGISNILLQSSPSNEMTSKDIVNINDPFSPRKNVRRNSFANLNASIRANVVGIVSPEDTPGIRNTPGSRKRRGSLSNETEGYSILSKYISREKKTYTVPYSPTMSMPVSMTHASTVSRPKIRRLSVPNIEDGKISFRERRISFIDDADIPRPG